MVRKAGCLVTPPELSDGDHFQVSCWFLTNRDHLFSFGNTNIQRSMMQIRSVTVCAACLWIQCVLYKMLPFKPRWSAFNDVGNRCAASYEAGSQLQLCLVIKQHYWFLFFYWYVQTHPQSCLHNPTFPGLIETFKTLLFTTAYQVAKFGFNTLFCSRLHSHVGALLQLTAY